MNEFTKDTPIRENMPSDNGIFICHASEDKETFVKDLANALRNKGLQVWYDDYSLTLGDSLRSKIDQGLANSRYGVVVLSEAFFRKDWPQKELNGLVAKETGSNKVILPIWHNIRKERVLHFSPILADRIAVSSDEGIDHVVEKILEVVRPSTIKKPKDSNIEEVSKIASAHLSQPSRLFPIGSIELRTFEWGTNGGKIADLDKINGALITIVPPDEIEVVNENMFRFSGGFVEYCSEEMLGQTPFTHHYLKFHIDYDEEKSKKIDAIIEKLAQIIRFRRIAFTFSDRVKFSYLVEVCSKKGLTGSYDFYTKTMKLAVQDIPREFQSASEIRMSEIENKSRLEFDILHVPLKNNPWKYETNKFYERINPHTIMDFFRLSP